MEFTTLSLLSTSLFLGACAENPVTGDSDFALVSEDEEVDQGRSYHPAIIKTCGSYDDPRLQLAPRSNQSVASLAQQSALEPDAINRLRLLNRSFPDGKITRLNSLKTVALDE
jgi:hypothetical protein